MEQASSGSDRPLTETLDSGGARLTIARPTGEARAGVIVLHEVWGMTAPVTSLVARLAECGYIAAAPHLYHRMGDPVVTDGKYRRARRFHDKLTADELAADIEGAQAWVRAQGARKAGLIGFSMGGTVALWAAATLEVDAAITFYGAGIGSPRWPGVSSGIDAASALKSPWLGLYGGSDSSTPARELKELRGALSGSPVPAALVVYPGVRHGFALDASRPHHAAAETRDAAERVRGFLGTHLA